MNLKSIISVVTLFLFVQTAYCQPSTEELKKRVHTYYGSNSSKISSIEFGKSKHEVRWDYNRWVNYWSRTYDVKLKTEYPGVYSIGYGGVQYTKSGSSYSYSNMLTGGFDHYEGIPNPSVDAINAHLKSNFDPLNFYNGYMMNYLIDAPNTIKLAADPGWRWIGLNEVRCNVEVTYTLKTSDIGNVEEQKGHYQLVIQRSGDGINFDENAKLLNNGKWIAYGKGDKKKTEKIKATIMDRTEFDATKTLAQLHAVRHAEEFKKSLAIIEMPEFKSGNHLMQFTHELLLEGDEAKVTAFMYKMLPRGFFEEWSDIVLNQNGKRMLAEATEDLLNYKKAYCQYPIVKEVGDYYVRFYDRNKQRMNRIAIAYENDRWYVTDIGYTIRNEDFAGYEQNGDDNCEGTPIFIDGPAAYKIGDKVQIFERGNWYDAEILKADMSKGGYSVKYGVSGLTIWKYVSEVRPNPNAAEEEVSEFVYFENGTKVSAKYTNVWYPGTILKVNYDMEEYFVDIPDRNIDVWLSYTELKPLDEKNEEGKAEEQKTETKEKRKLNIKTPKIILK